MSFGTHRIWKKIFVEIINPQDNQKIIDIGTGTSDISSKILEQNNSVDIFSADLNYLMLNNNKKNKYINDKIKNKLINTDAQELPFKNNYFDKYIISFCLRNVTDIQKTLKESFRILKEGGEFFCLEFSSASLPLICKIYDNYKDKFIPILGEYVSNQKNAYKYLSESINSFPNQDIILSEINKAGFSKVSYYNIFNGIVAIHKGWKI